MLKILLLSLVRFSNILENGTTFLTSESLFSDKNKIYFFPIQEVSTKKKTFNLQDALVIELLVHD